MSSWLRSAVFWLQTQESTGEAPGGDAGRAPNPLMDFLPMMLLIMLIWYFLVIRPDGKRRRDLEKQVAALKAGDEIVSTGGMLGKVQKVEEKYAVVQIDPNKDVRIRLLKTSIHVVNPPDVDGQDAKKS